ncbi:MAG: ATP synthase F1 subunit gamma [Patescibacteria group bacterium]|nr:ATP synthase F1 subunit gamma [Patescibacteria group bacterium]
MESTQILKKRLKTVANICHITKAMELVAATKMRKSQEIAINSRPYSLTALDLLANLSRQQIPEEKMPLILEKRPVKKTLLVLSGSDKGLVGSFNSNVFRTFENYLKENKIDLKSNDYLCLAVGEKSFNFLQKKSANIIDKFTRTGDFVSIEQTRPIADFLIEGFLQKRFDEAVLFSMNFQSAFYQKPIAQKIFPVDFENIKKTFRDIIPQSGRFADLLKEKNISSGGEYGRTILADDSSIYDFEPSLEKTIDELTRHLIKMHVYHLILEANASEHSSKRMAMKNAFDNGKELSDKLVISYNKSRQAAITNELIEINGASQL